MLYFNEKSDRLSHRKLWEKETNKAVNGIYWNHPYNPSYLRLDRGVCHMKLMLKYQPATTNDCKRSKNTRNNKRNLTNIAHLDYLP